MIRNYDTFPVSDQSVIVREFLEELSVNPLITEIELKFLTTYFRPRLGDNLFPDGYGPFLNLRNQRLALVNRFYYSRYSKSSGSTDSVFSSTKNFQHLKKLFASNNVLYGLVSTHFKYNLFFWIFITLQIF